MITKELLDYIVSERQRGVPETTIKSALQAQGWPIGDLDRAMQPGAAPDQLIVPQPIDPRSGRGENSPVPPEAKGWSWGAASLTWIWGLRFHVWMALVVFVPAVGSFWWIVLGLKGREWAWQHNTWRSVDDYRAAIQPWDKWGGILFVASILLMVGFFWLGFWLAISSAKLQTGTNLNLPLSNA